MLSLNSLNSLTLNTTQTSVLFQASGVSKVLPISKWLRIPQLVSFLFWFVFKSSRGARFRLWLFNMGSQHEPMKSEEVMGLRVVAAFPGYWFEEHLVCRWALRRAFDGWTMGSKHLSHSWGVIYLLRLRHATGRRKMRMMVENLAFWNR